MIIKNKRKATWQELADRVDELQEKLDNSISKDKIEKKIKRIKQEGKIKLKKLGGTDRCLTQLEYMHKENVLQELLNEGWLCGWFK